MTNIDAKFEDLEKLTEAALHNFDQTGDTHPVELFMEGFVLPVLAELIHDIVGHRHELEASQGLAVHYTSVSNLFSMFDDKTMRLYNSDNSNDPNEGAYFDLYASFLSHYSWLDMRSSAPAYLASFIISESHDDNYRCRDDLVYWRTYGDAARGCSIEFFSASRELQKVLYGDHEVNLTAQLLEEFLTKIAPLVELPSPIGSRFASLIADALNSIRYLYKSKDYEYEKECRLVTLRNKRKRSDIHFDYHRAHGGSTSVRHYCHDDRLGDC